MRSSQHEAEKVIRMLETQNQNLVSEITSRKEQLSTALGDVQAVKKQSSRDLNEASLEAESLRKQANAAQKELIKIKDQQEKALEVAVQNAVEVTKKSVMEQVGGHRNRLYSQTTLKRNLTHTSRA